MNIEARIDGSRAAVSKGALWTLLAVMFINLLGFGIVVPFLPIYAKSFHAAPLEIALIFSAYSIGSFFGEPFWGRLSDRIGRKPILISTVCGNCLCYFALAFAPTVYVAFLVRLLGGLASGNGSVIQAYIADVTPPDERTGRMSLLSAAYNAGFIVGPALGGLLADPSAGHAGFRLPLLVASALSATCALGLGLFLMESRHRNTRHSTQPSPLLVLREAISNPTISRLMIVTFLAGSAFMGIESIFSVWTQARFSWNPRDVGFAFMVVGIVAALCQVFLTEPLSRRYGEAQMLAAGMALTVFATALQPLSRGMVSIIGFLSLSAIGQSVAWPNVSALLSRNVDWRHQGQFLGLNNATGALARVAGPACAWLIFSDLGIDWPFFVASLAVLPAILLAFAARRDSFEPGPQVSLTESGLSIPARGPDSLEKNMRSGTMALHGDPNLEAITASDAEIAAAIKDAHLPSLIAAMVHVTGDPSLVLDGKKPVYDFFGDGQGGFTEQEIADLRARVVAGLKAYRDRGASLPAQPAPSTVRAMMNYISGAEIGDQYVPFFQEELALTSTDAKAKHWAEEIPDAVKKNFRVLIIGAGMSGMLAGIRLKQAGIPFTIVETNKDVGGTWLVNTYPGCRVDNPNHMYSYSFEPNHDWPQHFSTQPVLSAYFRRVAEKYDLRPSIRFETEMVEAAYDEARAVWRARTRRADGREETIEANAIISAVGQLNRPKLPDIKGVTSFKGPAFHSARWDHSVDLKGKRIAVIGTGASAFQFVPEIAPDAKELFVFQRTPPWLGATPNYHDNVAEGKKWLLKHVPYYAKWYRFWLFWMLTDGLYPMVQADPNWKGPPTAISEVNQGLRDLLVEYTKSQIANDDALVEAAVPNYPVGGKRSVRDNGVWLSALQRPNVETITTPIREITERGIVTKDGKEYAVDVLIYGTGFSASHFLEPMTFKGRKGVDLHEQWAGDARAYLGITIPNFPNLFVMYGPNTNIVVNGSIIFFSECEISYIQGCLELLLKSGSKSMEVKRDIHDRFNEKIDAANKNMAWGVPQVTSWYKNEKGRVSQNWPFPLVDYWKATRAPNPADFMLEKNVTEAVAAAE